VRQAAALGMAVSRKRCGLFTRDAPAAGECRGHFPKSVQNGPAAGSCFKEGNAKRAE
jgi:hypothetical protein